MYARPNGSLRPRWAAMRRRSTLRSCGAAGCPHRSLVAARLNRRRLCVPTTIQLIYIAALTPQRIRCCSRFCHPRYLLSLVLLFLLVPHAIAQPGPMLAARAWILIDATSGAALGSVANRRLEPASLTKLMTAYVAFNALKEDRIALGDTVSVSPAAFAAPGRLGARMYLEPGRAVSVDELLRGMLTVSATDAAVALAEHRLAASMRSSPHER